MPKSALDRIPSLEAASAALWHALSELGVERRDVDVTLEIHRGYLGLQRGWGGSKAASLLFEDGGERLGEDVGYGPARLLSNGDVHAVMTAIEATDLVSFVTRHHEWFAEEAKARQPAPSLLEEYDWFAPSLAAHEKTVRYLRDARTAGRALLVWFE